MNKDKIFNQENDMKVDSLIQKGLKAEDAIKVAEEESSESDFEE